MSPQDKLMVVANRLGLSTLKDMQGSTGAVYDVDTAQAGLLFSQASTHLNPAFTNVNQNKFEVNEALLIETIGFFVCNTASNDLSNWRSIAQQSDVIVFDLVIGNKRVIKDQPIFCQGGPNTFASSGVTAAAPIQSYAPRHQLFLESVGIVIPPQVEWSISYKIFNIVTGAITTLPSTFRLGAYIFGTRALLNFNTSL